MPMYTHVYLYYMPFYSHVWTSAAHTTVEHELYQGQSIVGNMCISDLYMNIYYCSDLWPTVFHLSSLAFTQFLFVH